MHIDKNTTPLRVKHREGIKATPQKVWKAISAPGILEKCHPFCKENPVKEWPGIGSRDRIIYNSGVILDRKFIAWEENSGYQLVIGRGAIAAATVVWKIIPQGSESSILEINIHSYPRVALQRYPALFRPLLQRLYFLPQMKHYVSCVVKGFQFFIETGNPVHRDQFGRNRIFS